VHLPIHGRSDSQGESFNRLDDDGAAFGHGRALLFEVPQTGTPKRPVELHAADRRGYRTNDRHAPDERSRPAANGQPAGRKRLHEQQPRKRQPSQRNRDSGRSDGPARRTRIREDEHDARGQRGSRTRAQDAVRRHVCFRHHQRGTEDNQNGAERGHS
jgi:hypothetical protein